MFSFDDKIITNEEFINLISNETYGIQNLRKVEYYNVACSFDIETTSFESKRLDSDGNSLEIKQAIMYVWQLCINGHTTMGRTWNEFVDLINNISSALKCNSEIRHLVIYCHNLSYEFQFMRKWFDWFSVFSLKERTPIKAITENGIEFRCSYILSGFSLAKLGEQLQKYKVEKLVGDLDYELIRHNKTKLTEKEIGYCVNDVKVVVAYIQEKIELEGGIIKIPLTNTGYVRNHVREKCLYIKDSKTHSRNRKYHDLMKSLTITKEEYMYLKEAFLGGFTHANCSYVNKTLYDVDSFDFTSSYPTVMVAEKFPMSKGKKVYPKDLSEAVKYMKSYCCILEVEFFDIIQKTDVFENIISASRCHDSKNIVENNGRVYGADYIRLIITEVDYESIIRFYDIDKTVIKCMWIYQRQYLPTEFVESILELYSDKTTLKDVKFKEIEYLRKKGMLNSAYGMAVTDICRDEIIYEEEDWDKSKPDYDKQLDVYNKSLKRFLYYPWGVYVTAYARRNLFSGILSCGKDYIYSDTDSLKIFNKSNHLDYIKDYNKYITNKLETALIYHKLPLELIRPKNQKGEEKPLGVWDEEPHCDRFKTLGAKRYLVEKQGKYTLTVAGLSKKNGIEYLIKTYKNEVFEHFNTDLDIPESDTGKLTHTYIDDEMRGVIKDKDGVKIEYYEKSGIHLSKAPYSLTLAQKYVDFLFDYMDIEL